MVYQSVGHSQFIVDTLLEGVYRPHQIWHIVPGPRARESNGDEPMPLPRFRTLRASLLVVLFTAISFSVPATAQNVQPQARTVNQRPFANSVILQGGSEAQTLQRLHVVRPYSLQNLRSNPRVTLGETQLDFTSLLNNPNALPNMAARLQALPQHVQVQASTSEINEVDQGLVIHHVLTYQILPGKCADAGAKAQLAEAGVTCFTRGTANQRVAEFSTPSSARYVADPGRRQAAIAAYQQRSAAEDADASKQIATLRASLANPAQRAAIVAKVGQAEATRMSSLSDDDLKDELINMSTQSVEETMFVPRLETANYAHPVNQVRQRQSRRVSQAPESRSKFGASPGRLWAATRRSNRESQDRPLLLFDRLHHRARLRVAMGRFDIDQLVCRRLHLNLRHHAQCRF
jgi:hypothetical protein